MRLTGRDSLTVMLMLLELAGFPVVQDALEVSLQLTTSPWTGTYEKTGPVPPETTPLTFHWYAGVVPPFEGVAVNCTMLAMHVGLEEAVMEILTGCIGLTFITIGLETTTVTGVQGELEVITQVTVSLGCGA